MVALHFSFFEFVLHRVNSVLETRDHVAVSVDFQIGMAKFTTLEELVLDVPGGTDAVFFFSNSVELLVHALQLFLVSIIFMVYFLQILLELPYKVGMFVG